MDYTITTANSPATKDGNLFSANVNIIFDTTDFVFLGLALVAPVVLFFAIKFLSQKI